MDAKKLVDFWINKSKLMVAEKEIPAHWNVLTGEVITHEEFIEATKGSKDEEVQKLYRLGRSFLEMAFKEKWDDFMEGKATSAAGAMLKAWAKENLGWESKDVGDDDVSDNFKLRVVNTDGDFLAFVEKLGMNVPREAKEVPKGKNPLVKRLF